MDGMVEFMFDVSALGEVLIDFTPAGKSELGNPRFDQNPGGAPANVLAALAKLGKRTAFIGKVGQDAFGAQLADVLSQSGIDISGLVRTAEAHTTLAFVHLNDEGDRSFSFCRNPGADVLLKPGEILRGNIEGTKIFHFGSISMTHEPAASATIEALRLAREKGILISYDPNLRIPLWPDLEQAKQRIEEGLSYADVVKLSEEELDFITGTDDLEAGSLRIAEQFQVKLLLITLGEKGCFYRLGGRCGRIPGFKVKQVDTTGAGDAFLGGILHGLLERGELLQGLTEMELQQIIVFANAMGALATTRMGAIPAMPCLQDIHKLMDQVDAASFTEAYRPQYHFTSASGWINDPNGMVYFDGEYHLCYQYHPWSSNWGPMHWGHAVSRDLVHWRQLPTALKPDGNGYIFSGSAVVDRNDTSGLFNGSAGLAAIFTHADEYPGTDRQRQRQSLAYSRDRGRTWIKYGHNPVLEDAAITDFRDPKVFWHQPGGIWVMVIAAGDHVRFYSSPNLTDWTLSGTFGQEEGSHDGVWECPDLFELPLEEGAGRSKWVLLVSIGDRDDLPAGSRTQYFIGDFDGERFTNDNAADTVLWTDHGRDNYAGVTWSDMPDSDGRRIYLGWMSNWKYANLTPTEGWRSAMTIPRSLALRETGGHIRLVQTPVRELEALRREAIRMENLALAPGGNPLGTYKGVNYEIDAEFELGTAAEFGFKLRCSESEETIIGYDAAANELFVDRTRSGVLDFHPEFACRHGAVLEPEGPTLKLRIFVDWSSVEVFAGRGQVVLTDLIYPSLESKGLELYVKEGSVKLVSLNIYALDSIHGRSNSLPEEDVKLEAKRIDCPLGI
jgi:fructan beta-fructosidase